MFSLRSTSGVFVHPVIFAGILSLQLPAVWIAGLLSSSLFQYPWSIALRGFCCSQLAELCAPSCVVFGLLTVRDFFGRSKE